MIVCCRECGCQIIMTIDGVWRQDIPFLRLNGAVYFCSDDCKETYTDKWLR